jgi:hypothetical protein
VSSQEQRRSGRVMRQAATGSFHAVELNVTASRETRIVAGRHNENTNVASRSAWALVSTAKDRSRTPTTKMAMNVWREAGIKVRVAKI